MISAGSASAGVIEPVFTAEPTPEVLPNSPKHKVVYQDSSTQIVCKSGKIKIRAATFALGFIRNSVAEMNAELSACNSDNSTQVYMINYIIFA